MTEEKNYNMAGTNKINPIMEINKGLPVPVTPELFFEVGLMAMIIPERSFALNPMYNVSLHSF